MEQGPNYSIGTIDYKLQIDETAEWTTRVLRQIHIYIQLIQSVWAESRACTLYSSLVNMHDFLSIPTGSDVSVSRNSLVFHFVSSSNLIYDRHFLLIYPGLGSDIGGSLRSHFSSYYYNIAATFLKFENYCTN